MEQKLVCLSSTGLKNIVLNNLGEEYDFKFIFGDREVKTNKIIAEFISPRVSHIHRSDPTINSIDISNIFSKISQKFLSLFTEKSISKFECLIEGKTIEISEPDLTFFRVLSIFLGNDEIYEKIKNMNSKCIEEKSIDDLLNDIEIFNEIENHSIDFSDLIDRLSLEFDKIDKKRIQTIPNSILYLILTNKNFKRENEDDFIDVVEKIMNNNESENFNFYEEVDYKKLSTSKFTEFINKFDYTQMTHIIWTKLCECFYVNYDQNSDVINQKKMNEKVLNFDGNSENRFNGIINYLTNKFGGNVSDKEIVSVTSLSENYRLYGPKNVVDFNNQNDFESKNEKNQWLMFDFKNRKIQPNCYSLKSRYYNNDNCNPQNWNIEVSNSGNENDWKIIDSRENVTSIKLHNQCDTFFINNQVELNEYYRFIRLRQTGKSTGDYDFLCLNSFEVFGKLIE